MLLSQLMVTVFIHDRWWESTFNKLWACHCQWQSCRKDTGCFSFLWVHNSVQAECTQAWPTIFPACHLYKVLTPMRLWSFTLQEFFIKNGEGRLISESAGMSSCVDWLISKHPCNSSWTQSEWRGSDSVPDAPMSLHQSSSPPGGDRKCRKLLVSSKW